jgi:hypothetical protein
VKIAIGAALIVVIALMGSRRTFTKIKLPLAARHIYLTGTEYIVVGLCLGSGMLDVLDEQTIGDLNPLLYLALGWIGLLFGVQLEMPQIARFPRQYFYLAMLQAVITVVVCFFPFLFLLKGVGGLTSYEIVGGALVLGAIAVPTGQSSLALINKELKLFRGSLTEILGFVAGIDAIVGLVILGFSFCFNKPGPIFDSAMNETAFYLAVSSAIGVITGGLLHMLTRIRCSQEELLLFTIGIVVFSAGAAAYLRLSPLFITATAGFVIANTKSAKVRISRALTTLEKPLYIVVLLLGGAMLKPDIGWVFLLGLSALYITLRASGKIIGGCVSSLALRKPQNLPAHLGLGLVSQGGIAAPMAVSFHQAFEGELANAILLVVFCSIIVNELIGPVLTGIAIRKA